MGDTEDRVTNSEENICLNLENSVFHSNKLVKLCGDICKLFLQIRERSNLIGDDNDYLETQNLRLDLEEKIALWRYYTNSINSKNKHIDLLIEDLEIIKKAAEK